jgi:hypothetical protein
MSDSSALSVSSSSFSCPDTCARCILFSFCEEGRAGRPDTDPLYRSLASFTNGLGIGSICCGLLGAAMLFGLHGSEEEARQKTLLLFQAIQEKYGSLYCPHLKQEGDDCQALLSEIRRQTERLLPIE